MNNVLIVPTSELGFEYDLELGSWSHKLDGFRAYLNGQKEALEGNLGMSLEVLSGYARSSAWFDQIPRCYRNQTKDFPDLEYYILWLAANSDKAAQLLLCRPLILVLVCRAYPSDKTRALEICEKGQREILKELSFDGSKSALKFIDKLRLNYKTGQELVYVENYLKAETQDYLRFRHYPLINDLILSVDQTLPFLTGTKLGRAFADYERQNIWNQVGYVKDTIRLGESLGIDRAHEIVARLHSFNAVIELHDRWTEQRIRAREIRPVDAREPYSCLLENGDSRICQIKNYDELLQESAEQKHCIVSYHSRIAEGKYAAFKMQEPERITIGLRRVDSDTGFQFEIDQIKGEKNARPSEASRLIIYEWFQNIKRRAIWP